MTSLLLLPCLLGYSAWLWRCTPWPTASLPLFSFAGVVCVLYAAALLGLLGPASLLLAGLGLLLFIAGLLQLGLGRWNWRSAGKELMPLALFALLGCLLWLKLQNAELDDWDDFSHWGLAAKDMFFRQALPGPSSWVQFKDYPPGGPLSAFFALRFNAFGLVAPAFSEGVALFGQGVLILAALLPLQGLLSTHGRGVQWLALAVAYFTLFGFGKGFRTLNIDHMLGIFLGMVLVVSFQLRHKVARHAFLLPVLLCLVLFKASGLLLALLALLCLAAVELSQAGNRGNRKVALAALLLIGLACWMTSASWKAHVRSMQAATSFQSKARPAQIFDTFIHDSNPVAAQIKRNFLDQLKPVRFGAAGSGAPAFTLQRTALAILALLMLSAYCARRCSQHAAEVRGWIRILMLGSVTGLVIYALGLLYLYLFAFGEYEALRLASFDRYMGTWLMAWSLVLLACLLETLPAQKEKGRRGPLLAISILLLCPLVNYGLERGLKFIVHPVTARSDAATQVKQLLRASEGVLKPEQSVFLVWQGSNGDHFFRFRYAALPARVGVDHIWSLGPTQDPADVWRKDLGVDQWSRLLAQHYDLVVIGKADQVFWSRYADLFEGAPDTFMRAQVFAVRRGAQGQARLQALAPIASPGSP